MWFMKGVILGVATGVMIGCEKGDEIGYIANKVKRKLIRFRRKYSF